MANVNAKTNLIIVEMAMHFSIVIYVGVLFFLAKSNPTQPWTSGWALKPENEMLFYVLLGLSVFSTILVIAVPFLVPNKKLEAARKNPLAMDTGARIPPALPEGIFLDYKNPDERVNKITILRMAFAESIAIFGFVLAFLNQAPWLILPFAVFALGLQVIFGPIVGKMMANS